MGAYWVYTQLFRVQDDRTNLIHEPFKPTLDFDTVPSVTPSERFYDKRDGGNGGQYYDPVAAGWKGFYGQYGTQGGYYDSGEWQPRLALPAPPPKECPYEKYDKDNAYKYIARKCGDQPQSYRKALAAHHPDANRFGSCDLAKATDRYSQMSALCDATKGCKSNAYDYVDQQYHARNCNQDPEQFLRVIELNDSDKLNPDCFETATKRVKDFAQTCGLMPILGPNHGERGDFYDPATQEWFVKIPYQDIQWPDQARNWAEYDREWKGVDAQEKIFPAVYENYE